MRRYMIIILLLLSGCVTLPASNTVREIKSDFDGATEIIMDRAYLFKADGSATTHSMSLSRRSTQPAGDVVLTVYIHDSASIADPDSLQFNIDGKVVSFTSMDRVGEVITGQYGVVVSKRYLISSAFIKSILDTDRVTVRVNLSTSYVDGLFSQDGEYSLRPAFRAFYDRVFGMSDRARSIKL